MTHYRFGVMVREEASERIQKIIDENREMFDLGLQGPDLLFFYRPYRKNMVSNIGYAFHVERAKEFLLHIYDVRDLKNSALTSYLLGMCCHYMLDRELHPFIWEKAPTSIEHQTLEASLERLTIERYYMTIKRCKLLPRKNLDVQALQIVYQEVSKKQLKEAMMTIRYLNHLLEYKKPLQFYEFLVKKKRVFSSLCIPKEVEVEEARELIPVLEETVEKAVSFIQMYLDEGLTREQYGRYAGYDFNGAALEGGIV